jgi:hypothetical protein
MKKFTQEQLEAAFKKVRNKEHWKNPVDAIIDATEDTELINEAVIHFTATTAEFAHIRCGPNKGKIHVKADGYRLGPAGDY